jgi:hypothetical protein
VGHEVVRIPVEFGGVDLFKGTGLWFHGGGCFVGK